MIVDVMMIFRQPRGEQRPEAGELLTLHW